MTTEYCGFRGDSDLPADECDISMAEIAQVFEMKQRPCRLLKKKNREAAKMNSDRLFLSHFDVSFFAFLAPLQSSSFNEGFSERS